MPVVGLLTSSYQGQGGALGIIAAIVTGDEVASHTAEAAQWDSLRKWCYTDDLVGNALIPSIRSEVHA